MSRLRDTAELYWPTLLVGGVCVGLGASNWLRPPVAVLAVGVCATAAAALVAGRELAAVALAVVLALAGLWWGAVRLEALGRSALAARIGALAEA